nr:ABC transporter substrate-binding protein [uncultured Cetobacterium sp.]
MKKRNKALLLSALFLGLATTSLAQKKFVLITMDSMDEHWLSVKKGAEEKAKDLGDVEIQFRAPAGKVDPNEQTRMVEDAINQEVDAILLAPSDKFALAPVVDRAIEEKIPVVIIDSPIDTEGYVTFLSTDNYAAGALAADTLANLVNSKGKVGIINAQPGAGTAIARSSGFEDRLKDKYPEMEVVAIQYSNGDKAVALNQATDIMTANPDLVGFYGSNEGSTVGISRALEEAGKGGTIKLVGFDFSKDTIIGLNNGTINASMVQNPYMMGAEGVQSAYDYIQGKDVKKHVDTGVKVVTKENL